MSAPTFVAYTDMVADLFHPGHLSFLRRVRAAAEARSDGRPVRLVVGIVSDDDAESYKRRPIMRLEERAEMVRGCRLVDEVVAPCATPVDAATLDAHRVDLVVHGDDLSAADLARWYSVPTARGRFVTVPYSHVVEDTAVSTTALIERVLERA